MKPKRYWLLEVMLKFKLLSTQHCISFIGNTTIGYHTLIWPKYYWADISIISTSLLYYSQKPFHHMVPLTFVLGSEFISISFFFNKLCSWICYSGILSNFTHRNITFFYNIIFFFSIGRFLIFYIFLWIIFF